MLDLPPPTADTPTLDDLIEAIDRLDPGTVPAWGKLNAASMLEHCARFVDLYLGRLTVSRPVRIMARLLGPLFLKRVLAKSPTATPRNLRTLGEIQVSPSAAAAFEPAAERLRSGLFELKGLSGVCRHVLYGQVEAETLKALVRHHTAHHFHQFGLL
ncbi:hypothetical protein Poly30_01480 [Planctomycetes bacterium Poly30]|uniref:DinB superfamily protein n=1 Tax=Saltatorellus ferox TaxID=2528018 RepID=A0A518EKN9_9BACT|nr:hypothetical protein Poly30_01480 [Planctomycetes bacterium Poly30]